MSSGAFTLASAPLLPWLAIASLGAACLLILGFGILRRGRVVSVMPDGEG